MTAYPTFHQATPSAENTAAPENLGSEGQVTEGWYVDPEQADRVRWWNGEMWTSRIGGEGDPIAWHDRLGDLPPPEPGTRVFSIVRATPEPVASTSPTAEAIIEPISISLGAYAPSRFIAPAAQPPDAQKVDASTTLIAVTPAGSSTRRAARRLLVAAATMAIAVSGAATAAVLLR